jgi:hypothetical protein
MKTLAISVLVLVAAALMLSCSPSGENVVPDAQKSFALIVPSATRPNTNLLLLSDGRAVIPSSGIPGFNHMRIGKRLSLLFRVTGTSNAVTSIQVIGFSAAQDTVPIVHAHDTTTFSGKFSGTVSQVTFARDSISGDTTSTSKYNSTATIIFKGSNYTCLASPGGYPAAGDGTVVVSTYGTITFTDKNTDANTVLNGIFLYSVNAGNLYMWRDRGNTYTAFALQRQ